MKFDIYRIKVQHIMDSSFDGNGGSLQYNLILVKASFSSMEDAVNYLKNNHENYVDYTILPNLYFTSDD